MDTQGSPAEPAEGVRATPPAAAMQGYDTFSASGRATAVAGDTSTIGARGRCDYTVCTSNQSLNSALDISASISAEFGFGGGDAKSEYTRKLETTSTSVVIAIYASVVSGTTVVTNPRLKDGVKPPDAAGLDSFFQGYGDSYISSLTHGGEYIATYTFYSQTRTEQQKVVAALQAHGVAMSGSVSGSIDVAVGQVASSEQVRVSFSQQLLGFSGVPLPQQDQMVAFALGLSGRTPNTPTVVAYETEGYEHVPGMEPRVWGPVLDARDLFLDHSLSTGVGGAVQAIDAMLSQTAWMRRVYAAYGYTLDAELASRARAVEGDAATLRTFIRRLQRDPTQSYTLPALPSLEFGLPVLNVTSPVLAGPWGGGGGGAFWDVNMQTILDGAPLRKVVVWASSAAVRRIEATYGNGPAVSHGGTGGDKGAPLQPLVLEPGELISSMSGRYGATLDHLTLTTTRGQTRDGGGPGGGPFSWTVPEPAGAKYTVVVGFGGRYGADLDALGPMTSTFSPASWQGRASLEVA